MILIPIKCIKIEEPSIKGVHFEMDMEVLERTNPEIIFILKMELR